MSSITSDTGVTYLRRTRRRQRSQGSRLYILRCNTSPFLSPSQTLRLSYSFPAPPTKSSPPPNFHVCKCHHPPFAVLYLVGCFDPSCGIAGHLLWGLGSCNFFPNSSLGLNLVRPESRENLQTSLHSSLYPWCTIMTLTHFNRNLGMDAAQLFVYVHKIQRCC